MHQIKLCSLDKKGLGKSSEKGQKKKKKVCGNKPYFHLKHNQKKKKKQTFLKTNVGNLIPLQYRGILRQPALQVFYF